MFLIFKKLIVSATELFSAITLIRFVCASDVNVEALLNKSEEDVQILQFFGFFFGKYHLPRKSYLTWHFS